MGFSPVSWAKLLIALVQQSMDFAAIKSIWFKIWFWLSARSETEVYLGHMSDTKI